MRASFFLMPIVALTLAACGTAAGNGGKPSGSQPANAITVNEAPAKLGAISSIFSYTAGVSPKWTVSVAPPASGQIVKLNVQQGQQVNQGDVIAVLDQRSLQDQVTQAQAGVDSAQAKLNTLLAGARPEDVAAANATAAAAQAAVNNLTQGRPDAIAQAEAALKAAQDKLAQAQSGGRSESVQQAQAKLDADQAALNKLQSGANPQDVTNARLAVEQAKDKLYADQTLYDAQVSRGQASKEQRQAALDVDQTGIDQANTSLAKLLAPPNANDVAQAQAAVTADQQALALAKQPNTGADIAQLQAAVTQAQTAVAQAKQPGSAAQIAQAQQQAAAQHANAVKAARPYTAQDVAEAQAAVGSAQATLQSAQTALSNATIVAPATGIISDVPVAVGSMASAASPIATEISPELELSAQVDQTQVALFKDGEPATIVLGSDKIPAQVFSVAPAADTQTRKFAVKVQPAVAASPLRAGMSTTVEIQTGQANNAVIVPQGAVIQRNGEQLVFTDVNGHAKMNIVQTGISNDANVQITGGVKAGDLVILPGSIDLADGNAVIAASASPAPAASSSPASSSSPSPAGASASAGK